MYLRDVLKAEKCEINGYTANSGKILKANDFVEIEVDTTRETAMKPQKIPLEIVYEDEFIIIVNKPSGLLVHPTHREKNGTLLNGLSYYLNHSKNIEADTIRPGLVHRLDKQTSGLMAITKTQKALKVLTNHFKRRLIEKRYLAIVEGVVSENEGKIIAPIGRFAEQKIWNIKEDGKYAETKFWVKERFSDKTLLELEPVTGRTNQLRIHCAFIGHPIIGDVKYGAKDFERLGLHAFRLCFHHPISNDWIEFTTDHPKDLESSDSFSK